MRYFHFSLGDSNDGPVGFCASLLAENAEDAARRLREKLGRWEAERELWTAGYEYVTVYFNPNAVSERDIDFSEKEDSGG